MSATVQPELFDRIRDVARAIDGLLIAAHTLRSSLKPGHVPFDADMSEGVARYGTGPVFGLWLQLRAVEALSIAWTGKPLPAVEAPALDETDEAPGLAAPVETAEAGADQQERLGV